MATITSPIVGILNLLFGCWHKNFSFPIDARRMSKKPDAAELTGHYVCCLDCGQEFPYDWSGMKVISGGQR